MKGVFSEFPSLALRQWRRLSGAAAVGSVEAKAEIQSTTAAEAPAPGSSETITQVVFLPREPQWAYCFWTISDSDLDLGRSRKALNLCLRLRDVSGASSGAQALQEIVLKDGVKEWFVPIPLADRDYQIELGYRLPAGGWHSLARSAVARIPGLEPSELVADQFVAFNLEAPPAPAAEPWVAPEAAQAAIHERLYQESLRRVWRSGSEEFQEHGAEGGQSDRQGLHDSGVGVWASGRNDSGIGGVAARQRSFWLVADAELIVYGATEPSATLRIGTEEVPLNPDGSFRIQVPFRDGQQLYPIEAVAADGVQKRSITLSFSRTTPEDHTNPRESARAEWF
ncbi:MAG: DUF4912 domain-containing protein [Cyanobacteriota bacterium]